VSRSSRVIPRLATVGATVGATHHPAYLLTEALHGSLPRVEDLEATLRKADIIGQPGKDI
jgi:hypothetical protein